MKNKVRAHPNWAGLQSDTMFKYRSSAHGITTPCTGSCFHVSHADGQMLNCSYGIPHSTIHIAYPVLLVHVCQHLLL